MEAAEQLNIDYRTLQSYESNKPKTPKPPCLTVIKMAEIYNAPYLKIKHLRNISEVGEEILPDPQCDDLRQAVISFQIEHDHTKTRINKMLEIAYDGKITPHEANEWHITKTEIQQLFMACLSLLCFDVSI